MILNLLTIIILTIGLAVANTILDYTRDTEDKNRLILTLNELDLKFLRDSVNRNMKFNTLGMLIIIAIIRELYCFKEFVGVNWFMYIVTCLVVLFISMKLLTMVYRLILSIRLDFPLHYWFSTISIVPNFIDIVRITELVMLISLILYGTYLFIF
jgi:hypothetical protein